MKSPNQLLDEIFTQVDSQKALAFDDVFYETIYDRLQEFSTCDLSRLMHREQNAHALSLGFRLLARANARDAVKDLNFWLSSDLDPKSALALLEYCQFNLPNPLIEEFALCALKSEYPFLLPLAVSILSQSSGTKVQNYLDSLLQNDHALSKAILLAEACV